MKQIKPTIFAIAFLFCLYILFFQTEWLGILIIENPEFPLGTLISWFMIIDFTYFVYSLFPTNFNTQWARKSRKILKVFILFGFLWGVFSYILAGNWNWVFTSRVNFLIWVLMTSLLIICPLVFVLILIFKKILKKLI